MPITIFHRETNAKETELVVNDDGTVTYHTERSGWPMMRKGIGGRDRQMSADQAKAEWPSYADDIDKALASLQRKGPA